MSEGIKVKVGDEPPNFEAPTSEGEKLSLKDLLGKKTVVLYFYPRDDTPGCTTEACGFRDNIQAIRKLGAEIIGVSLDGVDSHKKFKTKYNLPFTLVSDADKRIANAYGVLRETGTSTNRVTFIIDRKGKIAKIFPKVDASKHPEEVISTLRELQ